VLLFFLIWGGLSAAAMLALFLVVRARANREARRALRDMEGTAAEDQGMTLVQGKLVVDGQGLAREPGARGAEVAARTRWGSLRRLWQREPSVVLDERAKELWLETTRGRVKLDGSAVVVVGSRLRFTGEASLTGDRQKRFGLVTELGHGDAVAALGKRRVEAERTGSDAKGSAEYRHGAGHEVLEAPADRAPLRLVAVGRPRTSVAARAMLRSPWLVLVAPVLSVPAIAVARDYENTTDACAQYCSGSGACHVALQSPRELFAELGKAVQGYIFECEAQSDRDCHGSYDCKVHGSCSQVEGRCVAGKDVDCRHTPGCIEDGRCVAAEGHCIAGREDDCQRTPACRRDGWCAPVARRCRAASDEHCRGSEACSSNGECSAVDGKCVVAKDEDCQSTYECRWHGRCSAAGGRCVATAKDCKKGRECVQDGLCSVNPSNLCHAASNADCKYSRMCGVALRCVAESGSCKPDATTCAESDACRVHGRCDGNGSCDAISARDCEASLGCKERGACKLLAGECVASCADTWGCRFLGFCSQEGTGCVAATADDCRKADACRKEGKCVPVDGRCTARSNEDCKRSDDCKNEGSCSLVDGACVVATDADCRASIPCSRSGRCRAVEGRCVALTNSDCATSHECQDEYLRKCTAHNDKCERGFDDRWCLGRPECKEVGWCSANGNGCVAAGDHDCRQSAVCARYGWCVVDRSPDVAFRAAKGCFLPAL
jgi:hypothetical protein